MKRRIVLLFVAILPLVAGCRTDILHGLPEQDANQVIAVLQEQGVIGTKQLENPETNTWKVSVPSRDTLKVWGVLQEYRLPATPGRRFQDVFGKSKLVVAPIEEKALYLEALQGEISHTLEAVTGVVTARVHVVQPEPDITGQPQGDSKASVMVEYRPDAAGQPPLRLEEVQRIVANAVNGLKSESVSVVMKPIRMQQSQQTMEFTAFGPVAVAKASLGTVKVITVGVVIFVLFLGVMLFWQGRVLAQLRFELSNMERQLRSVQKPAR